MKRVALRFAAAIVRAIAAVCRLFIKQADRIVLISSQGDEPSRDILDLAEALKTGSDMPVVVMAGLMRRSLSGAFVFMPRLVSMLKQISASRIVAADAYCPAVSIPSKRPGQIVVQLWHAPEAIKKFSLQILDTKAGEDSDTAAALCMHRNYDYILCPSAATLPFFMEAFGYQKNIFVKYGLPSLDRVGEMRRPEPFEHEKPVRRSARELIYSKYPGLSMEDGGKRPLIIVYAPTFRDGSAIDANELILACKQIFYAARRSIVFVLKLHPLDIIKSGAVAERGDAITDTDFSLTCWYSTADVIITDYSGVAVEAAAANIASYYYIYDIDEYAEKRGLNIDLRKESVGKYAFTDARALAAQIYADFIGTESMYDYEVLSEFTKKYLEVPVTGNTERLARFIADL